ncbi:MAG: ATP-binding protein [Sphingosinicella sp.]
MRRLLPKSLIGQIALTMALALLIAQALNFTLIFTERQRTVRAQVESAALTRFVLFAQRVESFEPDERELFLPPETRRIRIWLSGQSPIAAAASDPQLTERLLDNAGVNGLELRDARGTVSELNAPAAVGGRSPVPPPDARAVDPRRLRALTLAAQLQDGSWVNARLVVPGPNRWLALRPALSTLLIYLIVLGALVLIARRLAQPLRELTGAAEAYRGRGEPPHVEPRGPADVQRAIHAFNAMGERVRAMLDEKDRMLGAIGHDLRTPLASLRIRAESIEPESEQARMIATIEEMTAMLDDTLMLARSGRAGEPERVIDLRALADTVVEDFRALGREVELEASENVSATVRSGLLRRAIRNLVENGLNYAGATQVSVKRSDGEAMIEVSDRGPGIPPAELARMPEAFYRGEPSRSRETGGYGLGLALARAAAQAHGGRLELENRQGGGLVARLVVPLGSADGQK